MLPCLEQRIDAVQLRQLVRFGVRWAEGERWQFGEVGWRIRATLDRCRESAALKMILGRTRCRRSSPRRRRAQMRVCPPRMRRTKAEPGQARVAAARQMREAVSCRRQEVQQEEKHAERSENEQHPPPRRGRRLATVAIADHPASVALRRRQPRAGYRLGACRPSQHIALDLSERASPRVRAHDLMSCAGERARSRGRSRGANDHARASSAEPASRPRYPAASSAKPCARQTFPQRVFRTDSEPLWQKSTRRFRRLSVPWETSQDAARPRLGGRRSPDRFDRPSRAQRFRTFVAAGLEAAQSDDTPRGRGARRERGRLRALPVAMGAAAQAMATAEQPRPAVGAQAVARGDHVSGAQGRLLGLQGPAHRLNDRAHRRSLSLRPARSRIRPCWSV